MDKINKIFKPWVKDKPIALGIGEWDDWYKTQRTQYPIRFFLFDTIPDAIETQYHIKITWPIRDWYWAWMHRYHPKHQYDIIKPRTLEPNYHDADTLILHTVMECLTDFVETQADSVNWNESSPQHANAYVEMVEIHDWWVNKWPFRELFTVNDVEIEQLPDLPKEWGHLAALNSKYKHEPQVIEWTRIARDHNVQEQEWVEMENEMLHRIINIRGFLWS